MGYFVFAAPMIQFPEGLLVTPLIVAFVGYIIGVEVKFLILDFAEQVQPVFVNLRVIARARELVG
jgi:hypothetical protein